MSWCCPRQLKTQPFRQTIRRTIGDVRVWNIEAARTEARRLAVVVRSDGDDPRELKRQQEAANAAVIAAAAAQLEAEQVQAVTVSDIWPRYLAEGKPKRKTHGSRVIVPH